AAAWIASRLLFCFFLVVHFRDWFVFRLPVPLETLRSGVATRIVIEFARARERAEEVGLPLEPRLRRGLVALDGPAAHGIFDLRHCQLQFGDSSGYPSAGGRF